MPQNVIISDLTLEQAKYHSKLYRDDGANTQIVDEGGGRYSVVVTFPPDWEPFEGEGEEPASGSDEPVETAPGGTASTPVQTRVPFATLPGPVAGLFWPVITSQALALVVSHKTSGGQIVGGASRLFLADRLGGSRYHVGVDLFCSEGDEVVSMADGEIVAFFRFYTRQTTGEETYALLVDHGDLVVNYGEVKADSPRRYGWRVGDRVRAGQKIARVSGTAMIHFETYTGETRITHKWMQNQANPPAVLRDPTKLLIDLAVGGRRLVPGGVALLASPGYDGLLPASAGWRRRFGGRRWRYDERGVYTEDLGNGPWRTEGEPETCRAMYRLYGPRILAAAARHGVNPALIMMTIATEAAFARDDGFTGPKTFRWEGHVENTDVSPVFRGSYSAGPMQCLATTVRDMLKRHGTRYGLDRYDAFEVAPAIRTRPNPAPASHPLYDAETSIEIGAGEIRMRWSTTGDDPMLVAAAYNAGGIYPSRHSAWGMRAYDDHLDRAARWYGDACAVLSEEGLL
ncbi:MAG: hypothetical protein ABS58_08665 [Mesorhizobium sp. SCN 65-20]|nr:MAG: hypothetical protein ABS58_08665 [Mesorhizobium sp. SCN 65-20]